MAHVSEYDDHDRPAEETGQPAPGLDDTQPVRPEGASYPPAGEQPPTAATAPGGQGVPGEPGGQPVGQPAPWGQPYGRPAHEQEHPTSAYPPGYFGQPAPPQHGYPGQPGHPGQQAQPKGRVVPSWLIPTVAAIALVVGLLGGVISSVLVSASMDGGGGSSVPIIGSDNGASAPLSARNGSVAAVAHRVLPSTVQIQAKGGADGSTQGGATGSGFVLDDKDHVITNNHVVADATGAGEIKVVDQDGKKYDATILGRSPVYDIAVLKVKDGDALKPAAIGSSRTMRVGDTVVAIGSPLGLSSTVTSGIVSATDRPVTTGDQNQSSYINAVQTDAAINPGNSGGPLVNLRGQVVGVNSAIATTGGSVGGESGNIGVGFAIPMEQVRVTASQILASGKAKYPVIGANVNTGNGTTGAQIVDVPSGSPAAEAGLRKGDVVTGVEGKKVTDGISLIVAIRSHQPGETITLAVKRGGKDRRVRVTLDGKEG